MNMLKAARETLALAADKGYADSVSDIPELDYPHLVSMIEKMETVPMSPAKMGRWLGWLQAACVAGTQGAVSLEDCKRINMENNHE
jgi:hypothetical protein